MATLRETQMCLQEKLELLRQKEKQIQILEIDAMSKDKDVEYLRKQLNESRTLVQRLAKMNSHQLQTINKLSVTTSTTAAASGESSIAAIISIHSRHY